MDRDFTGLAARARDDRPWEDCLPFQLRGGAGADLPPVGIRRIRHVSCVGTIDIIKVMMSMVGTDGMRHFSLGALARAVKGWTVGSQLDGA